MSLFRLALAYARRRPLSTLLVIVLLAIGVATVALTLLLSRELEDRLVRDAAGIDLVVGAKGSPLQLVLAGVYHVDVPPGNIPLESIAALRAGALWQKPLEAVLGSTVAAVSGLDVGAAFTGSHGLAEGGGEHADAPYRVIGILEPTGTVLDRLVLTSIASVWAVHETHHAEADHAKEAHGKEAKGQEPAEEHPELEPGREVTLALVRYKTPLAAASLPRAINKETELVAASPAYETARLLTVFGVGIDLVRAFALVLMAASGFMLFVALAQALEDRRYDLAILRTLGASRRQVALVLLVESLLLAAVGALLGLVLAHLAALGIGQWLPEAAPLAAAARRWLPEEWGVVGLALGAGILAALWPAWRAWRLDVAATLADG